MDTYWIIVLVGSLAVYSWKILGFLIPTRFASNSRVSDFAAALTVALLAALFAVQAFSSGQALKVDARLAAVLVAALLYWRKLPFIAVVAIAAAVAAGLRFFGIG
ncbi:MAG: AzlD domain-containing protein [Micrococcales bacterium]